MKTIIWINDTKLEALHFKAELMENSNVHSNKRKISFDFKVTSEDYHDIAVLLYQLNFRIRIPAQEWDFNASIIDYSTSITDLYKPNQVADYHLELLEQD
ncbi:DUF3219 family protein [Planococcus sp. S3-L1]|uniref:DUF3219 family protein n=1 Tax=Planococcus sp. S3-L1 TaxID=3046200 RepID=UPI0024B8EDF5|nr:DUF3219 family protein [Planococcus sp. S3-L1]MDJ0331265.1 DUF3219 family protein [Planococcus sp. S3-L1]